MENSVFGILNDWRKVIIEFFVNYPVAASIVTILAIATVILLNKHWRKDKLSTNILIVFAAWAICVPLLGVVFKGFGYIISIIIEMWEVIKGLLTALYEIYKENTILVIVILLLSIIVFFIMEKRPLKFMKSRKVRAVNLIALDIIIIFILHPICRLFIN